MVMQLQRRRGSIHRQNQVMSCGASASATTRLPRDVIASILIRLPASDLRRSRRVCKEWRDAISDPSFIKAHMAHGPRAPTHTVVFAASSEQRAGRAFLLDEQWRLTARFNAGESQVLIGTCNGLLCFHDEIQGAVKVVEPFTGESIAVPVPKEPVWSRCALQYCFGYDATTTQYKIVHKGYQRQLKVFTVGADEEWRTVKIAHASWYEYGPACNGGAVYWSYEDNDHGGILKHARFDLATEEITSVESRRVDSQPIICHHSWWQRGEPCIIQIRWLVGDGGESTGGYWPHNMNPWRTRSISST
ncbi:putative F-box protein At1g47790 [Triticum dicoccoides]|uniref:putative F-box protein At1g47790 n=1 Tax=Triticum dicoccoides TaxID=85692 RepID=UPI00188F87A8|nr:putative F-box protein At1g47790 [Triticum dicoccoides]